jgi:cell division septation protein DedD
LQYLGPLATSQSATPKIRENYAAALVASGRNSEARQVLAVDLPPDQVNSAMDGFSAVIAQSLAAPAPPPPPPAPTVTQVQTTTVVSTPVSQAASPVPLTPAAAPAPADPPQAYVPDNSTAAYTGPSPIPVTASSSTPGPVATPPDPAPMPPAPAPPAPVQAAPSANAVTGGAAVQLGALNSPADAERAWRNISDTVPALFTGKEPNIQPVTINGKTLYRLRVGGFDKKADAAKFCGEVSAAGNACTVANF